VERLPRSQRLGILAGAYEVCAAIARLIGLRRRVRGDRWRAAHPACRTRPSVRGERDRHDLLRPRRPPVRRSRGRHRL